MADMPFADAGKTPTEVQQQQQLLLLLLLLPLSQKHRSKFQTNRSYPNYELPVDDYGYRNYELPVDDYGIGSPISPSPYQSFPTRLLLKSAKRLRM
jgi:hypothetical protein